MQSLCHHNAIILTNISTLCSVRGKRALFLADFSQPDHIFDQISGLFLFHFKRKQNVYVVYLVLYSLPLYMVKSLVLVLPYFPTGTMERVEFEGQVRVFCQTILSYSMCPWPEAVRIKVWRAMQVATAKTLARILSAIPLSASGPVRIVIFDIHALQERFYFGDKYAILWRDFNNHPLFLIHAWSFVLSVIIILVSAMPLFSRYVKANFPQDEVCMSIECPTTTIHWKLLHVRLLSLFPMTARASVSEVSSSIQM